MLNFERSSSVEQALALFDQEVQKLGLIYSMTGDRLMHPFQSCLLYDSAGHFLDVGHGKGRGLQASASAKYEAFEHYLSDQCSKILSEVTFSTSANIWSQITEKNRAFLKRLIKKEHFSTKTAWINLQNYASDEKFQVPLFFISPDYCSASYDLDEINYETQPVVSTNNGTAIGTSYAEAMIHAINEVIERDAISCFLLSTFVQKDATKISLIEKESIPEEFQALIHDFEVQHNEEILLFDITNDSNIPAFGASLSRQKQKIQPLGFGASLSNTYALERAILEVQQSFYLYKNHPLDFNLNREDEHILALFEEWVVFKNSAQCDLPLRISKGQFKKKKFTPSKVSSIAPVDLLVKMVSHLKKHGFEIYFCVHYRSISGINCVRVVIPDLEFFHLVRYGKFIIPGPRGEKILTRCIAND